MNTTELQLFESSEVHGRADIFNKTLQAIFPNNSEDQKLASARLTLELSDSEYSDAKLTTLLADFEYMANVWLDAFERQQFNGKTLSELLKK
jgi:hypothetical protein